MISVFYGLINLCFLLSVPQIGSIRILERTHVSSGFVNLPQRRNLVKPLNAEPQRNDSLVPLAATIVAPGKFPFFVITYTFSFERQFDFKVLFP